MSPRQLVRLRNLRAPDNPNADELTQSQVRQMANTAEDYEQFQGAVLSQIRLAQGSQSWTQPPYPSDATGGPTNANGYPSKVGQAISGELLSGPQDGINTAYVLSHFAVAQTVQVYYNGLRLCVGQNEDYVITESVAGQGFDTVSLTGAAPLRARDRIWADYIRSA